MIMKCSNCGNMVPDGEKFCQKCGSKIENESKSNQNTKYCSNCGEPIEENSEFCSHCGVTTNKEKKSNESSINNQNTKFCANCGAEINVNAVACPKCGARASANNQFRQQANRKFCSNCGTEVNINAVVCTNCGASIAGNAGVSEEKSVGLSIVLSILLSGLGHFYLGLNQRGVTFLIAYIISCILMLFVIGFILAPAVWIWCLIDVIKSTEALNAGEYVEDKLF